MCVCVCACVIIVACCIDRPTNFDTAGSRALSYGVDTRQQNYNLSACFQKSFERLKDRLEGLESCVAGLEDGCSSISERLSAADNSMQQFTARAESLREQRTQLGKHADQAR